MTCADGSEDVHYPPPESGAVGSQNGSQDVGARARHFRRLWSLPRAAATIFGFPVEETHRRHDDPQRPERAGRIRRGLLPGGDQGQRRGPRRHAPPSPRSAASATGTTRRPANRSCNYIAALTGERSHRVPVDVNRLLRITPSAAGSHRTYRDSGRRQAAAATNSRHSRHLYQGQAQILERIPGRGPPSSHQPFTPIRLNVISRQVWRVSVTPSAQSWAY